MAFLGFDDTQNERIWSDDEVNILQTLARNIASSIERIANETAINESEEKFAYLPTIFQVLFICLITNAILRFISMMK
jgi:GAF domain-containing protein